ncbi:hypothetical protein M8818_006267 [Zalaria obscura]|uniref:Uncharacterized protein n=1 Tax=Zalaria obscura TaxID=2024903 RepID=A0ACC3S7D6_9PEZI
MILVADLRLRDPPTDRISVNRASARYWLRFASKGATRPFPRPSSTEIGGDAGLRLALLAVFLSSSQKPTANPGS